MLDAIGRIDCLAGATTGVFKAVDLQTCHIHNYASSSLEELKPIEHGIVEVCYAETDKVS